ncbi:MAG: hypothetical protein LBN22_03575 [Clostridiales Family XIII bacterium]|jgi:hypothetical protein|nr:hypothetical protein [Clostridiales Family XIII bacterium]
MLEQELDALSAIAKYKARYLRVFEEMQSMRTAYEYDKQVERVIHDDAIAELKQIIAEEHERYQRLTRWTNEIILEYEIRIREIEK